MKLSDTKIYAITASTVLVLVQLYAFKNLAYMLLMLYMLAVSSLKLVRGTQLDRNWFCLFFFFVLFCLYQIRPSVTLVDQRFVDLFYLAPITMVFLSGAVRHKIDALQVYKGLVVSSITLCFFNLVLHAVGWFPEALVQAPYANVRWMGGFDGPNEFGQFYTLSFALLLGLSLHRIVSPSLLVIGTSVFLLALWFSYSRGGLLSLAVLLLSFMFIRLRARGRLRLLLLCALLFFPASGWIDTLISNFSDVRSNSSDRQGIFLASLELFYGAPLLGSGIGGFSEYATVRNDTPHSEYLYFLVSGGLVAFFTVLGGFFYLCLDSYRHKRYPEFLFFVTFAAHGLTFNNLVRGRLSIFFWLILLVYLWSASWRRRKGVFSVYESVPFNKRSPAI